ncbi:MAG: carbon-nitrogen hydrolase family protein [Alphaproteobacteria bacterium]|nr:carbon-nitrogen hydrolase family protein [Alphaproteobacteria bacterium]
MKCSLVQMNSIDDKAKNIAMARALIEQAVAEDRPDWVLLPETFDWAGGTSAQRLAAAEIVPGGPAYLMCQEMARTHRIFVHAGSINERVEGENKVYNTSVVFDRDGRQIALYRKIHLFDVTTPDGVEFKESKHVKAGDAVVTYDCEGVTIGAAICYDLRFPELFQALATKGAQVIALPAAFTMQTGKDHWEVLVRARAIETETYLAAAGQCGAYTQGNAQRQTYGHSMIVDPWGLVVARASDGPGVVTSRIDPRKVQQVRAQIPVHQHRRLPFGA